MPPGNKAKVEHSMLHVVAEGCGACPRARGMPGASACAVHSCHRAPHRGPLKVRTDVLCPDAQPFWQHARGCMSFTAPVSTKSTTLLRRVRLLGTALVSGYKVQAA